MRISGQYWQCLASARAAMSVDMNVCFQFPMQYSIRRSHGQRSCRQHKCESAPVVHGECNYVQNIWLTVGVVVVKTFSIVLLLLRAGRSGCHVQAILSNCRFACNAEVNTICWALCKCLQWVHTNWTKLFIEISDRVRLSAFVARDRHICWQSIWSITPHPFKTTNTNISDRMQYNMCELIETTCANWPVTIFLFACMDNWIDPLRIMKCKKKSRTCAVRNSIRFAFVCRNWQTAA